MIFAWLKQVEGKYLFSGWEQLAAILLNKVDKIALNLSESDAQIAFNYVLDAFLLHFVYVYCESIIWIELSLRVNDLLAATDLT